MPPPASSAVAMGTEEEKPYEPPTEKLLDNNHDLYAETTSQVDDEEREITQALYNDGMCVCVCVCVCVGVCIL